MKRIPRSFVLSSVLLLVAAFSSGDRVLAESIRERVDSTVIPSFKLSMTTPAEALQDIATRAGIKVFYTPRTPDWPTFSVDVNDLTAADALEMVAQLSNLELTYADDGAHLQPTAKPPAEFRTLTDAGAVRFMQLFEKKRRDRAEKSSIVKAGDVAPDFTCRTLAGEDFSLGQEKGKVVIIDFFATWCGPCVQELPQLEREVFQKFRDRKDFKMLTIGRRHDADQLETFRKEKQLSLPMAPEPEGDIFPKYATDIIPRLYLIGRDGKVKLAVTGYTPDTFKEMLEALRKELGGV